MKRTVYSIDPDKWYHLETLKKYYKDYKVEQHDQVNDRGIKFTVIIFSQLFISYDYISHPKTGRFKYITQNTLKEIEYN